MSGPHQNPKRKIRFIHTVITVMETSNFKRARSELVGNVRKSFDHDPVGGRGAEDGLKELSDRSITGSHPCECLTHSESVAGTWSGFNTVGVVDRKKITKGLRVRLSDELIE